MARKRKFVVSLVLTVDEDKDEGLKTRKKDIASHCGGRLNGFIRDKRLRERGWVEKVTVRSVDVD